MPKSELGFKFCSSCGQAVSGQQAFKAANPVVKFCSECGFQLDGSNGKCENPTCPYLGKVPPVA